MGLNMQNPSEKLLDWTESYLQQFDLLNANLLQNKPVKQEDLISYDLLEQAIREYNKERYEDLFHQIVQSASGIQLLEFFLEQSLLQRGHSFLFIWSGYRMVKFLNNNDAHKLLKLAGWSLLDDQYRTAEKTAAQEKNVLVFELDHAFRQLETETFIRDSAIRRNQRSFHLPDDSSNLSQNSHFEASEDIPGLVSAFVNGDSRKVENFTSSICAAHDRKWIWKFINALPENRLNSELVLVLDAARGLLRNPNNDNPSDINARIAHQLGSFCYD